MRISPTRRGKILILAAAGTLGVALVNVNITTCLTASGILSVLVSSFVMSLFSLNRLELKRGPLKDGTAGGKISLPVMIKNSGRGTRQSVIVSEAVPFADKKVLNVPVQPLARNANIVITRQVYAAKRGFYKLTYISLVSGDPAGLFRTVRRFNLPGELMIYPESVKLSYMPIRIKRQIASSVLGRPIGISGMGQEFFGVREYRHSDGVRFIHWKSSARHKKLMVRDFEANASTKVSIFLETHRKSTGMDETYSNLEYLIKTAASIVNYLSGMYCQILFVTSTEKDRVWVSTGEAFGVKDRIMNSLATLMSTDCRIDELLRVESDYVRPNSILYCLTMSETPGITKYFDILTERGVDIRWIHAPAKYFLSPGAPASVHEPADLGMFLEGLVPFIARQDLNISRMLSYG
ncbi:MAG: hypothetical protein A2020_07545 [Lentisphaerae bacterium GWF2_45_14]|nr:MAG: hypothetical protein A2020_07545 [Lentisphaerae bacterium GWF2_45_14]